MRPVSAAPRNERGAIMVISTIGVVVAMIATALSVDLGRLAQEKRRDQKVADLAALDAVRDLPNRQARAAESAVRNGFPTGAGYSVVADLGKMESGSFVTDPAGDAVRVTATSPFSNAFVSGSRTVSASAVAKVREDAGFSIGSSVARVNAGFKSPVLNRTLEKLLGGSAGSLTLDAAGYQGLSTASVTLGDIRSQMGFATVDDLLNADVKVKDLLDAMAIVLDNQGVAAAAYVNSIKAVTNSSITVKLGDIVHVDQGVGEKAASGEINVMQLIVASAEVANKDNFAAGCINVPNALDNAIVTGLGRVGTDLCLKVTEAPRIYVGPVGGFRTTSQVEITFNSTIDVPITLPAPLGDLLKAKGSLPVKVVAGGAKGTLSAVNCTGANQGITVTVDTEAASTSVDGMVDLVVLSTGLIAAADVNVKGHATGPSQTGIPLSFLHPSEFSPAAPSKTTPASPISTSLTASPGADVRITIPPLISVVLTGEVVSQAVLDASMPLLDQIGLRMRGQEMASMGAAVGIADVAALAEFFNPSYCGVPGLVG